MMNQIDRREFIKRCALTGAGFVVGPSLAQAIEQDNIGQKYELCAIVGDKYFENTPKAVDALGGMRRFVRKGNTVGILINSPLDNPGAYTNPDIALAVVKMCLDSGAKQIITLNEVQERYWKRSSRYQNMKPVISSIRYSDEMTEVTIDKGKALKSAEVVKSLISCDVYINIPIIKDHKGTKFTCSMKNVMGACSGSTCRRFHFGENSGLLSILTGYYSNIETLSQSIADINLVRRPDICVVDATKILTTNGPSGPGEIRTPGEIIVATNCIAADMYAVRHLGLNWEDLPVIRRAQSHGYGPQSLNEIRIQSL